MVELPFDAVRVRDRGIRFLEIYSGDQDLMRRIGERNSWEFRSVVALEAASIYVPSFAEHVNAISLTEFYDPADVNLAIHRLSKCANLVDLEIIFDAWNVTVLSLDLIADCCLGLKRLKIWFLSEWKGSLKTLRNLKSYELVTSDKEHEDDLLPVASADSLEYLNLSWWSLDNDAVVLTSRLTNATLPAFTALTTLRIEPLCNSDCRLLIDSNIRLSTFHTSIKKDDIEETRVSYSLLDDILTCACLSKVRRLTLLIERGHFGADDHRFIVETIIRRMDRTVEELTLGLGISVGWCYQLRYLRSLRSLYWIAAESELTVTAGTDGGDVSQELAVILRRAFEHRVLVTAQVIPDEDYAELWSEYLSLL
jgi:hypothetical protein